jgi:acyl-coenzyme A thioesterase PaaI-like protein
MSALSKVLKNMNPSVTLRAVWSRLRNIPGGGIVMGRMLGVLAPYTGTIRPEVVTLEPGFSSIRIHDRRAVRNHLSSVHAIALLNLGEVATGTALLFTIPDNARGIIVHLGMDYLKKARGTLTAECNCPPISGTEKKQYDITADIKNEAGEVVARAHAKWQVGPV